jgi:hypothetical protein
MKAILNQPLSQGRRFLENHLVVDSQNHLGFPSQSQWNQHLLKNNNLRLKKKLSHPPLLNLLLLIKIKALILEMDLIQLKLSFSNLPAVTDLISLEDFHNQK